ncbi:MAG TPA: peroxiredoxin [Caulobacteraceae bacterium]|jgi:peroxiredoxin|nr:peroxiredoxin [Caulobacteraceae bacterium]
MKTLVTLAAAAALASSGAHAALAVGENAPEFSASAFVGGKAFDFDLAKALRKGPVVLYFFPAAFTSGCTIEAHQFADAAEEYQKLGATLIGITAGNVDRVGEFSTVECRNKFPVAADPGAKIAAEYKSTLALKPGWSDRTSYVIAPNDKILMVYSDLKPDQHVAKTLEAVKSWRAEHRAAM